MCLNGIYSGFWSCSVPSWVHEGETYILPPWKVHEALGSAGEKGFGGFQNHALPATQNHEPVIELHDPLTISFTCLAEKMSFRVPPEVQPRLNASHFGDNGINLFFFLGF